MLSGPWGCDRCIDGTLVWNRASQPSRRAGREDDVVVFYKCNRCGAQLRLASPGAWRQTVVSALLSLVILAGLGWVASQVMPLLSGPMPEPGRLAREVPLLLLYLGLAAVGVANLVGLFLHVRDRKRVALLKAPGVPRLD